MSPALEVFEASVSEGKIQVLGLRLDDFFALSPSVYDADPRDETKVGPKRALLHIPTGRWLHTFDEHTNIARTRAMRVLEVVRAVDVDWSEEDQDKLVAEIEAKVGGKSFRERVRDAAKVEKKERKAKTLLALFDAAPEWRGSTLEAIEDLPLAERSGNCNRRTNCEKEHLRIYSYKSERIEYRHIENVPCARIVHPSGAVARVRIEESI